LQERNIRESHENALLSNGVEIRRANAAGSREVGTQGAAGDVASTRATSCTLQHSSAKGTTPVAAGEVVDISRSSFTFDVSRRWSAADAATLDLVDVSRPRMPLMLKRTPLRPAAEPAILGKEGGGGRGRQEAARGGRAERSGRNTARKTAANLFFASSHAPRETEDRQHSVFSLRHDMRVMSNSGAQHYTLQHTATHGKHAATCCVRKQTVTRCNTLQHAATRCDTLKHAATHQHTTTHCKTLQLTGTWHSS